MPLIKIPQKRPLDATPQRVIELQKVGLSIQQIADMWHISRQRVYQLLAKVKSQ